MNWNRRVKLDCLMFEKRETWTTSRDEEEVWWTGKEKQKNVSFLHHSGKRKRWLEISFVSLSTHAHTTTSKERQLFNIRTRRLLTDDWDSLTYRRAKECTTSRFLRRWSALELDRSDERWRIDGTHCDLYWSRTDDSERSAATSNSNRRDHCHWSSLRRDSNSMEANHWHRAQLWYNCLFYWQVCPSSSLKKTSLSEFHRGQDIYVWKNFHPVVVHWSNGWQYVDWIVANEYKAKLRTCLFEERISRSYLEVHFTLNVEKDLKTNERRLFVALADRSYQTAGEADGNDDQFRPEWPF